MADVILKNVCLCSLNDGQTRVYVPNSGKIASVTDRVNLRDNSESFERSPSTVKFDSPGIDSHDGNNVGTNNS